MRKILIAALFTTLTACLDTSGANTITLDFDFDVAGENWVPAASDFDVGQEATVDLVGELRPLESPLNTAVSGLYLAGTNYNDDLFTYFKKYLCCLAPGATFTATIEMQIASRVHAGCTALGPNVWVKAGASTDEPASVDVAGVYGFTLDKGDQAAAGDYTQLGDIRNTLTGCPAPGTWDTKVTLRRRQSVSFTTAADGGFWFYFGVESGDPGRHELYFTAMRLVLD